VLTAPVGIARRARAFGAVARLRRAVVVPELFAKGKFDRCPLIERARKKISSSNLLIVGSNLLSQQDKNSPRQRADRPVTLLATSCMRRLLHKQVRRASIMEEGKEPQ
jgi:hypothetical protein